MSLIIIFGINLPFAWDISIATNKQGNIRREKFYLLWKVMQTENKNKKEKQMGFIIITLSVIILKILINSHIKQCEISEGSRFLQQ